MQFAVLAFFTIAAVLYGCTRRELPMNVTFSFSKITEPATGWHIIQLNAIHPDNPEQNLSVKITPEGGNNMFSFQVGDYELLESPEELGTLLDRLRGTPILYPTPNRVRDGTYVFMGDTIKMSFQGEEKPRMIHGLVWDDTSWQFSEPEILPDAVRFKTWYVFDEKNPRFQAYPFRSTLSVAYTLTKDRVRISYEVENQDQKPLGFGFALHPFWRQIGGKEKTHIQVALPYHMEATKDLLPTGKLDPVEGTQWDIREPKSVSDLSLDDVYFGATPKSTVRVLYDAIGLNLRQEATADFTHIVVYTPDREYFCIENQTCSTDAHNLFSKGFEHESHLQIVDPGEKTGGHVDFIVEWGN